MKQLDILTFGEAMAMFIANDTGDLSEIHSFSKSMAGAETNVSVGLARLGYQVAWLSKVGNDSFGEFILKTLKSEGVNTSFVKRDNTRFTGFQLKSKIENGDPVVEYYRRNSAASTMCMRDFESSSILQAKHLHMTGIPIALSPSVKEFASYIQTSYKEAGRTISFDPNLRPVLWDSEDQMVDCINEFAFQSDWVFPGIAEGKVLTGYTLKEDIANFYHDKGVKLVVVKMGETGAYYSTMDKKGFVDGFRVPEVIDTVGAGDGFAVGVLSGLFDGLSVAEATQRGNAIGAMAVMSPGDMDGLPIREKLNQFILEGVTQ